MTSSSQSYVFSSSHAWMWELDHKESWSPKNWCFWTVVLEKTLESPLDSKEIKPVNPNGNESRIFIGRTDAGTEAPILWPPDAKKRLTGKDPDAGKDWKQEEKQMTEDEMVGWYHWLDGQELEQAMGGVIDREDWHAAVHGVVKSQTWLSNKNNNKTTKKKCVRTNELTYKIETDLKNKLMVTREKVGGRDRLGVWDWHVHTIMFKIEIQQGSTL